MADPAAPVDPEPVPGEPPPPAAPPPAATAFESAAPAGTAAAAADFSAAPAHDADGDSGLDLGERPEIYVGAAFLGGLVLAQALRFISSRRG